MTSKDFKAKFRKSIDILQNAVDHTTDLDRQHPKLYKKVYKYYEEAGVEFYNDPYEDYHIVIECVEKDLNYAEVV